MIKIKKISLALVLVIVFLFVSNVVVTIASSQKTSVLSQKQNELVELQRENRTLNAQNIKNDSLMLLKLKAEEVGFKDPENLVYLGVEPPLAQLP